MNNNRNNRRRGRGNRNQSGNGNQVNRIDSRARGNAPQMLEKYKKLAQDAQHNGDRVQMEYYLQFADHYFRVIADNKARQDEARGRRFEEREQPQDDGDDDFDFDRPRAPERVSRQRRDGSDETPVLAGSEEGDFGSEGEPFLGDTEDDARAESEAAAERASARRSRQRKPREEGAAEKRPAKPAERAERAERPRRKPRRKDEDDQPTGIDSSILPPSIRAEEGGESDGNLEAVG